MRRQARSHRGPAASRQGSPRPADCRISSSRKRRSGRAGHVLFAARYSPSMAARRVSSSTIRIRSDTASRSLAGRNAPPAPAPALLHFPPAPLFGGQTLRHRARPRPAFSTLRPWRPSALPATPRPRHGRSGAASNCIASPCASRNSHHRRSSARALSGSPDPLFLLGGCLNCFQRVGDAWSGKMAAMHHRMAEAAAHCSSRADAGGASAPRLPPGSSPCAFCSSARWRRPFPVGPVPWFSLLLLRPHRRDDTRMERNCFWRDGGS